MKVKNETAAVYAVSDEDAILARAAEILLKRASQAGDVMGSPDIVSNFLRCKLATVEHEMFAVIWTDAQNRVIEYEEVFRGTLMQTSVYPREIVKAALKVNAAGVILAHNHPSGVPEPSQADKVLTTALKTALALVDVKVLDHFVVALGSTVSFAQRGLL